MSATAAPYGLRPWNLDGSAYKSEIQEIILTANSATGFFKGDIVNVGAGVITPIAATPTTTRNGNTPWGIFVGAKWYDANRYNETNFFPANGYTSYSGYGTITLMVLTNPDIMFRIQANGSVAATAVGKNAALTFGTAGSTVTGNSGVALDSATVATTNTLAVRIKAITPIDSNAAGDAYTDCLCIWNQNVHADRNILGV